MSPQPWTVRAVNLPEHSDNPIHTDAGAHASGFPRALVAGVTTYAVLTRPVVADDPEWVGSGAGEVRLVAPVFDDDEIVVTPTDSEGRTGVAAVVGGSTKATLTLLSAATVTSELLGHAGTIIHPLEPMSVPIVGTYADYGTRAGDDLAMYQKGVVHPSVWLNLANRMYAKQLVNGSWVHTRSRFVHRSIARVGDVVSISGHVVRRFSTSSGERAVSLIQLTVDGRAVVDIEHEAIVAMHAAT
jgi:hypothetical protein